MRAHPDACASVRPSDLLRRCADWLCGRYETWRAMRDPLSRETLGDDSPASYVDADRPRTRITETP